MPHQMRSHLTHDPAALFFSPTIERQNNLDTVAILAQGTSWAVAVTQAFLFHWFKPLLATP